MREPGLVEAITLFHDNGAQEVACNLKNTARFGPDEVFKRAAARAGELGLEIEHSYTTGVGELILTHITHSTIVIHYIILIAYRTN